MIKKFWNAYANAINSVPVPVWIVAIAVVALWSFNLHIGLNAESNDDRGTFGDMFGMANSIFSGFAFIGLIWTITLQRREMRRLDQASRNDDFKTTFYELLRAMTDNADRVLVRWKEHDNGPFNNGDFVEKDSPFEGKDALNLLLLRFKADLHNEIERDKKIPYGFMRNQINHPFMQPSVDIYGRETTRDHRVFHRAYNVFFDSNGHHIAHYFRSVYVVLAHIDNPNNPDTIDRRLYATILRSRLSNVEENFLMMNYASSHTSVPFNDLIDKYAMFQTIGTKGVGRFCIEFYNINAFGRSAEKVKKLIEMRAIDGPGKSLQQQIKNYGF